MCNRFKVRSLSIINKRACGSSQNCLPGTVYEADLSINLGVWPQFTGNKGSPMLARLHYIKSTSDIV